jgi:hypothetical protein
MTDEISKDVLIKMYLLRDGLKATRTELARALNIKQDYLNKKMDILKNREIFLETQEIVYGCHGGSSIKFKFNKTKLQKYIANDPLFKLLFDDLRDLNFNLSLFDN